MLGYQSDVVNGQLVYSPTVESYLPVNYAPVAPSALWQSQSAQVIPASLSAQLASGPTQTPGGTGTMPESWSAPSSAMGWLHPTKYPVVGAIAFLLVGLMVLRYVHWS